MYRVAGSHHCRQLAKVLEKTDGGAPWPTCSRSAVDIKDFLSTEGECIGWRQERTARAYHALQTCQEETMKTFGGIAISRLTQRIDRDVNEKRVTGP
jgi:hypothetical protein